MLPVGVWAASSIMPHPPTPRRCTSPKATRVLNLALLGLSQVQRSPKSSWTSRQVNSGRIGDRLRTGTALMDCLHLVPLYHYFPSFPASASCRSEHTSLVTEINEELGLVLRVVVLTLSRALSSVFPLLSLYLYFPLSYFSDQRLLFSIFVSTYYSIASSPWISHYLLLARDLRLPSNPWPLAVRRKACV